MKVVKSRVKVLKRLEIYKSQTSVDEKPHPVFVKELQFRNIYLQLKGLKSFRRWSYQCGHMSLVG